MDPHCMKYMAHKYTLLSAIWVSGIQPASHQRGWMKVKGLVTRVKYSSLVRCPSYVSLIFLSAVWMGSNACIGTSIVENVSQNISQMSTMRDASLTNF